LSQSAAGQVAAKREYSRHFRQTSEKLDDGFRFEESVTAYLATLIDHKVYAGLYSSAGANDCSDIKDLRLLAEPGDKSPG